MNKVYPRTSILGRLVNPREEKLHLTPVPDDEGKDWIEWGFNEIGVVLGVETSKKNLGVYVMVRSEVGYCFIDEIRIIS